MTTTSPARRVAVGACAAAAALAALVATGRALPFPPDLRPARLDAWATEVGPAVATFTALRGLAAVLLGWAVATATAGIVARRLRWRSLVRSLDRLSLPIVRRFANAVAGTALVVTSVAGTAVAGATPPTTPPPVVTMHDLGPVTAGSASGSAADQTSAPPTTSTTTTSRASSTTTTAVPPSMSPSTSVGTPPPSTSSSTVTAPSPAPPPPTSAVPPPSMAQRPAPLVAMRSLGPVAVPPVAGPVAPPSPPRQAPGPARAPATWTVQPGDTLWHVAERTVRDRDGSPVDAAAVQTELERLIAVNAERLVVPGNADLIYPGQELLVP